MIFLGASCNMGEVCSPHPQTYLNVTLSPSPDLLECNPQTYLNVMLSHPQTYLSVMLSRLDENALEHSHVILLVWAHCVRLLGKVGMWVWVCFVCTCVCGVSACACVCVYGVCVCVLFRCTCACECGVCLCACVCMCCGLCCFIKLHVYVVLCPRLYETLVPSSTNCSKWQRRWAVPVVMATCVMKARGLIGVQAERLSDPVHSLHLLASHHLQLRSRAWWVQ